MRSMMQVRVSRALESTGGRHGLAGKRSRPTSGVVLAQGMLGNRGLRRWIANRNPDVDAVHSSQEASGSQLDSARGSGMSPVQRKAIVSPPADPCEREADDVADKVMRTVAPGPIGSSPASIQRKCAACEEEDEKEGTIQAKRAVSVDPDTTLGTGLAVRAAQRGGEPLPRAMRDFFEPRFGRDFGHVRIHAGGEATQAAQAVRARAYVVGQDIVFNRGEYAPGATEGRRLLA